MLSEQDINDYKKAGVIVKEALNYGKSLISPGNSILSVCKLIEEKIVSLGGGIAFPAQISINDTAAHWCPDINDDSVFTENDLVKLDIGCHINGFIADTAVSIDLTKDNKYSRLISAAETARDNALSIIRPGVSLGEIGRVIQDTITSMGFSPVRNLSGHGLGKYVVHTNPSVPNYDTGDNTVLTEGMVIAVEPFATTGKGAIYEQERANIYSLDKKPRPVRNTYARQALKIISGYKGLPFCLRWLAEQMGEGQARIAVRELIKQEIITQYAPLVEVTRKVVSQAEHSVIVFDRPLVYTR